jgi:chromosomal replication initiation ATPase DnaA
MFVVSAAQTTKGAKALLTKRQTEARLQQVSLCKERIKRIAADRFSTADYSALMVRQVGDRGFGSIPRVTTEDKGRLLIRSVAHEYGVTFHDLIGEGRSKCFVFPRQLAMYRLRHERGLSYPQIAKLFNKDHSTCCYAVERMENLIQRGEFSFKKHTQEPRTGHSVPARCLPSLVGPCLSLL